MIRTDVLMCTYWDWSNLGFKVVESLRRIGISTIGFKGQPHTFNYHQQLPIHTALNAAKPYCNFPIIVNCSELAKYIDRSKVVWFSAETFVNTGTSLAGHGVVVDYGGSTYRLHPEECNAVFNPIVDDTVILFPTLLGLGGKNEHLIYYPVDTDMIQPVYRKDFSKPLRIGHFPSSTWSKGTDVIGPVIAKLKKEYGDKLTYYGPVDCTMRGTGDADWLMNIERMMACDILIETIKPELEGRPFGEWGNQALESAALGKIVVTNSIHNDIYLKEYGDHELMIANDAEQLEAQLVRIFDMKDDEFIKKQRATREWVQTKHSMVQTANYIYDRVLSKHLT